MSPSSVSPLEPFDLLSLIQKAVQGNDLTAFEAEFAFDVFMEGEASAGSDGRASHSASGEG